MSEPVTQWEIQARLVYAIIVAGKSAKFAEGVIRRLFYGSDELPFEAITRWVKQGRALEILRTARSGCYQKIWKSFVDIAALDRPDTLDLKTCTPAQLQKIHGVGPKTARFFIIWIRPEERFAALDVHVLRWMRANGYPHAPKATPQSPKLYAELEKAFIAEADKRGVTVRELDAKIWMDGSGYKE